jgi:uncharacterized protein YoxC
MNLPSDTPKMQKWIFWVADLMLVTAAWFIHIGADHPNGGVALVSTVGCVVAAVFVFVVPFIVEYARGQDEALDNRQRSLQALSVTIAAASEQVSIAALGLQGIAEAAQENFSRTERLSEQINEKIAELETRLAGAKKDDGDSAAKLESVAKKIARASTEFDAAVNRAAEAARAASAAVSVPPQVPVHVPELPPVIASRIAEVKPAVAKSEHPFVSPLSSEAHPPVPAPMEVPAEPAPAPGQVAAQPPVEPAAPAEAPPAPAPRKRSPRKAAVAESPVAPVEQLGELAAPEPAAPVPNLVLEPVPQDEPAPAPEPEIPEPAVSADGATRLIVTAYIGIGNRLFIRGEGAGLTWEKGVPLTFVSIGKWRWETNDASSTVRYKLYKNDQVECTSLGVGSVEPGAQQELSAAF